MTSRFISSFIPSQSLLPCARAHVSCVSSQCSPEIHTVSQMAWIVIFLFFSFYFDEVAAGVALLC